MVSQQWETVLVRIVILMTVLILMTIISKILPFIVNSIKHPSSKNPIMAFVGRLLAVFLLVVGILWGGITSIHFLANIPDVAAVLIFDRILSPYTNKWKVWILLLIDVLGWSVLLSIGLPDITKQHFIVAMVLTNVFGVKLIWEERKSVANILPP